MAPCPYCGTVGPDASDGVLSCPGCGAPLDVKREMTASGWLQLPPSRDLARIQCGNSSLQLEGNIVPVADFALSPGDGVYFPHQELLWKEPGTEIGTMTMKGAWKRVFAGLPIRMLWAAGPGRIAFSRDAPGEILAIPVAAGNAVDVREHVFVCATTNTTYDYFSTGVWFETRNGDETETHYPVGWLMDRFYAPQRPGLVLIHAHGDAFVRVLAAGETLLLKPAALLYKDPSVQMMLHVESPHAAGGGFAAFFTRLAAPRSLLLRLVGPGRVAMQSAYSHFHDPHGQMIRSSPGTVKQW